MHVNLVGSGPAIEAVEAALDDAEVPVGHSDPEGIDEAYFAVVADETGGELIERADAVAREAGIPLVAVEAGGIGGHGIAEVDAAVTGFAPGSGCYQCLCDRVAANLDDEPTERGEADAADLRLAGAVAGREIVTLLGGDDSSLIGSVVEVPYRRRSFLPVPGCICDEGAERTFRPDHETVPLEETIASAERALDDRVGVVSEIGEVDSYPAPYYLARLCDTSEFSDATAARQAAGVDEDWNRAFMRALGEAIERYSAGVYRETDFPIAPLADLDAAVSPEAFVQRDDAPSVDPEEPLAWAPATNLATREGAYLPAEAVHFPPPSKRHLPAITTGLGLGTSPVDAALSGLYEVVERDATMLSWYSTFEPLELSVEDDSFDRLARRAESEGLSITPLLVTQDVDVPVVTVAVHREEWPRFAVGSSADLRPVAAARDALAEAVQNWMELRAMGPEEADQQDSAIGDYAEFPDFAREFVDAEGPVPAKSVGPDHVPSGVEELDAVASRIVDADLDPYVAPITPRDVGEIGFTAVRAAVPGAQPLFVGEPVFGDRARSVPEAMGYEARLDRPTHPYP